MKHQLLLTFNAGSSSIKLGAFAMLEDGLRRLGSGAIDLNRRPLVLRLHDGAASADVALKAPVTDDLHEVIDETLGEIARHFEIRDLLGVGHRVVHGGDRFDRATRIDAGSLAAIEALTPLAPLHQPHSLRLIHAMAHLRPDVPQVASFDTAFHRGQSPLVRRLAIPRELYDQGIRRYGFHGLSYRYIASQMALRWPALAAGRVIVGHLGSGASLCAIHDGRSVDSSMGFSTLDGVPMATRCGALDAGVLLHLLEHLGHTPAEVEDMLYHRSGLLGMSGISGDSRVLLASPAPEAREALDVFALRVAREIAGLATSLGGVDTLVFTAGIGEHQWQVRQSICSHLQWLGADVDADANQRNAEHFESRRSRIGLMVIPTDEEQVIAEEAFQNLQQ